MTGEGSVRLRVDGFVSQVIALGDTAQVIDLPMLRPTQGEVTQNVVVEGKAPFVILTTDYVDFRTGLTVDGRANFDMTWVALQSC